MRDTMIAFGLGLVVSGAAGGMTTGWSLDNFERYYTTDFMAYGDSGAIDHAIFETTNGPIDSSVWDVDTSRMFPTVDFGITHRSSGSETLLEAMGSMSIGTDPGDAFYKQYDVVAFQQFYMDFTVVESMDVLFSAVLGANSNSRAVLRRMDMAGLNHVVSTGVDGGEVSSSEVFTLGPGHYAFEVSMDLRAGGFGEIDPVSVFGEFEASLSVVPAPGSLALLMGGGLVVGRRRR
jgi:hypothetical protein